MLLLKFTIMIIITSILIYLYKIVNKYINKERTLVIYMTSIIFIFAIQIISAIVNNIFGV